tara:strand:+ start:154 stop:336 length:183 start_codon:yes stop_codon:yes gene_type:complete
LITALQNEYEFLIHEDFESEVDLTAAEYLEWLNTLSDSELVAETSTGKGYTLDEFMHNHS